MTELFHTGIRVPDLDAAMTQLGAGLGVSWAEAMHSKAQPLWTPERGQQDLELRFVYSVEGPNRLELLEGPAGSFWDGNDLPGVHHLGVWCDDVTAEAERLLAAGWSLCAARCAPEEGFGSYAYLQPPTGTIVELVDTAARPRFEAWWAGGSL